MKKKKYLITLTNHGSLMVESYDRRDGGVYWVDGSIQGYAVNDQIKSIDEIKNDKKIEITEAKKEE